jgi:small-conductance mechanosensitive channel
MHGFFTMLNAQDAQPPPMLAPPPTGAENAFNAAWLWLVEIPPGRFIWILAALAGYLLLHFLRRRLGELLKGRGETGHVRRLFCDLIARTWSLFLFVASFAILSPLLDLPPQADAVLRGAFIVLLALQAAVWASTLVTSILLRYATRAAGDRSTLASASTLMQTFVNFAVWTIAVLFILSNLGIDVTALVAGLGIGGIAIGLAAQGIFSDLFASLSIVLDKPFVKGDFVTFGDMMGAVEKIGVKTTRIRALSGEQIVVSNAKLLSENIRNYQRLYERRVEVRLNILYETPIEKLEEIPGWIRAAIDEAGGTRFDRAHFKEYGESGLVFEYVYFALTADYNRYMDTQQKINLALFGRLAEEGVTFAYPTRMLRFEPIERELETARAGNGRDKGQRVRRQQR